MDLDLLLSDLRKDELGQSENPDHGASRDDEEFDLAVDDFLADEQAEQEIAASLVSPSKRHTNGRDSLANLPRTKPNAVFPVTPATVRPTTSISSAKSSSPTRTKTSPTRHPDSSVASPLQREVTSRQIQRTAELVTPPAKRSKLMSPATSSSRSAQTRRRFPGPAGLLPELQPGQSIDDVLPEDFYQKIKKTPLRASQVASDSHEHDDFASEAWRSMEDELELSSRANHPIRQFKLSEISRRGFRGKIPFLAVIIKDINFNAHDATVIVKDPTGQMKGTIHRKALETYRDVEMTAGAVLVLRQVTVFSPSTRSHYLNITASNIAYLFPPHSDTMSQRERRTMIKSVDLKGELKRFETVQHTVSTTLQRPHIPNAQQSNLRPSSASTTPYGGQGRPAQYMSRESHRHDLADNNNPPQRAQEHAASTALGRSSAQQIHTSSTRAVPNPPSTAQTQSNSHQVSASTKPTNSFSPTSAVAATTAASEPQDSPASQAAQALGVDENELDALIGMLDDDD